MYNTIFPKSLKAGDGIALLSPASAINNDYVYGAAEVLENKGFRPVIFPHALDTFGSYSSSAANRLRDITEAVTDPAIRAIMCCRGGYGTVHLLQHFPVEAFIADPKWIIGFSDISALHALAASNNVASIHSSMCKHLTITQGDDYCSTSLFNILKGDRPEYSIEPHPYNNEGMAEGKILGGNLAVIADLIATPYNIMGIDGSILFIEDIAEPIYKVERIMYQLKLSGILDRISALIIGQFTEYKPDKNFADMYEMLHDMTRKLNKPVVFNFPTGHVDYNLPLIESAHVSLEVNSEKVKLTFI